MTSYSYDPDRISVRLANTIEEVEASQAIRYQVFYEENGAFATPQTLTSQLDVDDYDEYADHLIVLDKDRGSGADRIVGTYRLLRNQAAQKYGQFYTSNEFDISSLEPIGDGLLELGRSCVLSDYRSKHVLQKLWQGIAHYIADNNIDLMFGCASLHGTNIDDLAEPLSYLYHYHLADSDQCPKALDEHYVSMDIIEKDKLDAKKVFSALPPLVKGYLRLGACIGDGAVVDKQFNTTDICIVLPTAQVTDKYVKHYERVTQKSMPRETAPSTT